MAVIKRGFLLYDEDSKTFRIDTAETTSVVMARLLLNRITEAGAYARGRMLDVGCGKMPYRELFRPLVKIHVGTDWPNTLHANPEIDVLSTNIALPFKGSCFDTVLCTEVLEHSPEPYAAMGEMARVLKSGGHLILTAPFFYWLHELPWDYFRFTRFALERMAVDSGMEVVYIKPVGGLMAVVSDLLSKLLLRYFRPGVSVFFQKAYLRSASAMDRVLQRLGGRIFFRKVGHVHKSMSNLVSLGHVMVCRKP